MWFRVGGYVNARISCECSALSCLHCPCDSQSQRSREGALLCCCYVLSTAWQSYDTHTCTHTHTHTHTRTRARARAQSRDNHVICVVATKYAHIVATRVWQNSQLLYLLQHRAPRRKLNYWIAASSSAEYYCSLLVEQPCPGMGWSVHLNLYRKPHHTHRGRDSEKEYTYAHALCVGPETKYNVCIIICTYILMDRFCAEHFKQRRTSS